MSESRHVRSIALDSILTVITLGLFNLWVQARQMAAVNDMVAEERYTFWLWLVLSLITPLSSTTARWRPARRSASLGQRMSKRPK